MKKLILIFLLLTFPFTLFSQGNTFGVKMGPNLTSFHKINSEAKIGYTFGVFYDITLYKKILLSFEINYLINKTLLKNINIFVAEGISHRDENAIYSSDYSLLIYYLELPLYIKLNIPLKYNLLLQPFIGFTYYSFPIKDRTKEKKWNFLGEPNMIEADVLSTGERAHINNRTGISIGSSFYFKKFLFQMKYFSSFTDIGGFFTVQTIQHKFKSSSFQILIGYSF